MKGIPGGHDSGTLLEDTRGARRAEPAIPDAKGEIRDPMKWNIPENTEIFKRLAVVALFSILLLTVCGGGGDGNGNVTGPGGSVSVPDPGVADIRDEFLAAINQARTAARLCGSASYGPSPQVAWSDRLAMAAYLHSEDMALNHYFSHTGSDGSSAGQRISAQGYPWTACGENLAVALPSVSSVVQGWLASEEHCRNIMDPGFTEIGAGYAVGPYGGDPSARYWTLTLADR